MDSSSITSHESGRKRPSHRMRACWECKKRKIQGSSVYSDSNDAHQFLDLSSIPTENAREENTCPLHVGERLSKLESLFEKYVCRKFGSSSPAPRSTTPVASSERKEQQFVFLPAIPKDAQSIASIGEGILAAQHTTWNSAPSVRTLVEKNEHAQSPKCDAMRRALVALLPSQHDADIIFESSNGWMILGGMYRPEKEIFVNRDPESYALDMAIIGQERIVVIARTLLHLAVCISCLPPEFDVGCLSNIWNLDATMETYVSTVTSLVTSIDEPLLTLPGLETLLLLALYQVNISNLRQAWLIVRRAMNLAHLMGFHRIVGEVPVTPPVAAIQSSVYLWRNIVDLDRYLSLHLRLPFGAEDYPLCDDDGPNVVHRVHIATICRQISELDRTITPQTYVEALSLDEKLEAMMKEHPKDFWDVPNVPPTARTTESFAVLERLMVQMWHFELKTLIHLPFMLRAARESRYEYSKVTALQSSRNIVMRWFALRNAGITQACCRFGELGVFIAAVTLILDILIEMATKEKQEVTKSKGSDFAMVCRLVGEWEKLAKASPREKIAARSAVVLKKILSTLDPARRGSGKARLTMPYFGTIEIEYKQIPERPAFDLDSDTAKKLNYNATGEHLPVFSFVSNSLWPLADGADDAMDFDLVLFDGLMDQDVEGNWVF